ncbi:ATP-dependent DNA helicase RecG [Limnobacter litoralis]|uniref:ATP-dependent DNA helicase RecG n=1 Tax=Limnobacter litoralis TaxID=481366 RepID=A0ABQ5YN67_9BURK|nr:ATP-dependent DNA helicase RecG [Limnobacter litoralis]GLR26013.1 ATP-dependent DNA helicase RecG [Limnobacter litoralis]
MSSNPSFPELEPLPSSISEQAGGLLHASHWMGLALHLPLRFEDHATLTAMDSLTVGQKVNLNATVMAKEVQYQPRKQLKVWVQDGDTELLLRWLHFYPGLIQKLEEGTQLLISGQIRQSYGCLEIVHPQIKISRLGQIGESSVSSANQAVQKLEPVYPSTGQLKQAQWRAWMKKLPRACFEDTLTEQQCKAHGLMPLNEALNTLHGEAEPHLLFDLNQRTHPAWTRLKVDELLAQQLLLQVYRTQRTQEKAETLPIGKSNLINAFLRQLPFRLTGAQQRALLEIQQDLAKPYPMQRLLQGDVGSGKTLVAALACLTAVEHGKQAAILAPTEVLAEQHYFKLKPLLDKVNVHSAKLLGNLKKSEKNRVLASLADGSCQVVIGTHALVQEAVAFNRLALVIVDEQHRFGVAQRLELIRKAPPGYLAHQLMMSATPIPRTLAQTYLSDLSVSNLDEKPPGRKPIITKLLSQGKRDQLIQAIELEINQGRQVYWVCPLIEESEKLDLQAAQATYEGLLEALPKHRIGLLHGKQDSKEKQSTMQAFSAGGIDLLVSTTVIEVGVDVGNASLMVIDQAERFGLAQLHQLRGRVGRGENQSVCVLLYGNPLSATAKARLKAMHESDDGFFLAEKDLEIRGPGELLGKRQSGMPMLRYADPMTERTLLQKARTIATEMNPDSAQAQRHIRRWTEETPWWLS